MCQLTLMHGDSNLIRLLATILMQENSIKNPDGWGIYTNKLGIIKSEKQSLLDPKFIETTETLRDSMLLGHVRLSSYSNKYEKGRNINVNDSHPFEHGNIILAHNGSLFRKDKKLERPNMIDSEDFAIELEANYSLFKDMPLSIKETYNEFDGTFAFLIYEKEGDKYYVVRGNKKLLHFCNLEYKFSGKVHKITIVNTDNVTLEFSLGILEKFLRTFYGGLEIKRKTIELIPQDSIYCYDPDLRILVKVGDVVEIEHEYPKKANITQTVNTEKATIPMLKSNPNSTDAKSFFDIGYYLSLDGLDIDEVHVLFGSLFNIHMFDITPETKLEIINKVLRYFNIKKKMLWSTIKYKYLTANNYKTVMDIYTDYNLKFPYFLNGIGKLKKIQKALTK